MSRAPVKRPPAPAQNCAEVEQAAAMANLSAHADRLLGPPDAAPGEEGDGYKALIAIGAVFERWEKACVWLRKRWTWLIPALWFASNFVSPELRALLNQLLGILIQNATQAAATAAASGGV